MISTLKINTIFLLLLLITHPTIQVYKAFLASEKTELEEETENKPSQAYDYYTLSLLWAPSICDDIMYCQQVLRSSDINQWIIKGIYPISKYGGGPTNCSKTKFNLNKIKKETRSQLKQYWVPLKKIEKYKNYKVSWNKYGTCFDFSRYNTKRTEQEFFFSKALRLRSDLNPIYYGLSQNTEPNRIKVLLQIFEDTLNTRPFLVCKLDKKLNQNLVEIRLSLDLNFKPVDNVGKEVLDKCDPNKIVYIPKA